MPKPYKPHIVSGASELLARRALAIDWFSAVGTPGGSYRNAERVKDWDAALATLVSQEWDDYLLDAQNAMTGPVPRPQIDNWAWAIEQANKVIEPSVPQIIHARLPASGEVRDVAVQRVVGVVRLACLEAHFQQFVKRPFFHELFKWLEAGRLPCGAVGEYPSPTLRVF